MKSDVRKWLFGISFLMSLGMPAQNRLEIHVEGVASESGLIQVALFNSNNGFLKSDGAFRLSSVKAKKGTTRVLMDNIPTGIYALAVFHDLNANEQLDTNWIGIPKEPMGFSNSRVKTFGPPGFEECRLELKQDMAISVQLE